MRLLASRSLINITKRDDGDDNGKGHGGADPDDDDDNEDENNHDHDEMEPFSDVVYGENSYKQ